MSSLGILSDLIRRSTENYPIQAYGDFYHQGAVCALGGAVIAWWAQKGVLSGTAPETLDCDEWESEVYALLEDEQEDLYTYCPVDNCAAFEAQYSRPIQEIVEHLNDFHHWTRERIADWVDEAEREAHHVAAR